MLTIGNHSDDQLWYFKHLGDNEYSIRTHDQNDENDQKEILKFNYAYA